MSEIFIGMNDHPSIQFNFDTPNFHDPDTIWFLDSVTFDGCRADTCPKVFYEQIIYYCQQEIKKK